METRISNKAPWLYSKMYDLVWIIGPLWFSTILSVIIYHLNPNKFSEVPVWGWVLLVMCIDVSHVYSTLYRTYFDKDERQKYGKLLYSIPLICWVAGVVIYCIGSTLFWTVLAYIAVYHFIRQQYGFMMLYGRFENSLPKRFKYIDQAAIYAATLYPVLYWHSTLPRNFYWFVRGDFIQGVTPLMALAGLVVSIILAFIYLAKEVYIWIKFQSFNIAKNLLLIGTALAWYVGIVALNADLPFTITNVISHGVPYIALIWVYGKKKENDGGSKRWIFKLQALPAFIGILILLSFFEESLWDALVWRDHASVFGFAQTWLPKIEEQMILALMVPLLAVPQATHYVLDGFIWRMKKPTQRFNELMYGERSLA